MVYDFDDLPDKSPPPFTYPLVPMGALEIATALLQLAAIFLTPDPDATFTRDELVAEARRLAGDKLTLSDVSFATVFRGEPPFLKKKGKKYRMA